MLFLRVGVMLLLILPIIGCDQHSSARNISVSQNKKWIRFDSKQCKFSILMPALPKSKTSTIKGKTGTGSSTIFELQPKQSGDSSAYSIICGQFPHGYIAKFEPYDFLERTWKGRFGDMKNGLVYEKRFKMGDVPAIEFQYKSAGVSTTVLTTSRYYLTRDRTYLVSVSSPSQAIKQGSSTRFLDSFRIIE